MDNKEVDIAMRNRTPVTYNGQHYTRILEYVMWYDIKNNRNLSVVLLDENGRCTIRVPSEKVHVYFKGC